MIISSYTPALACLLSPTPPSKGKEISFLAVAENDRRDEVQMLGNLFPSKTSTRLVGSNKSTVLKAMGEHPWIHIACPIEDRALLLHDGKLTLDELSHCRGTTVKELAFLSESGAEVAPGMLAAGYPSVVAGTSSNANVAKVFYETLLEDRKAGRELQVAHALHNAVTLVKKDDGNIDEWVDFVHYGI